MSHFDDAKELVSHVKGALPELEQAYQSSLHEQTVKPALLIDIKNVMENLRSWRWSTRPTDYSTGMGH